MDLIKIQAIDFYPDIQNFYNILPYICIQLKQE